MPDSTDDFLKNFGLPPVPKNPLVKKVEKGLPWEAKTINGKYYVPLEQVVELLRQNNVLPAVRRGLENRIALLETQKDV